MSRTKKKKEVVETGESVVDSKPEVLDETLVVEEDEHAPIEEVVEQLKDEDKATEEVPEGAISGEPIDLVSLSDEDYLKLSKATAVILPERKNISETGKKPKKESLDFSEDIQRVIDASSLSTRNDFELDKELDYIFTKLVEEDSEEETPFDSLVKKLRETDKDTVVKELEIDPELARKLKEDLVK